MKIDNLRSLIRESINEYISEINAAGDKAACEAKITATQAAIEKRKKVMELDGLDEAYHDMIDKGKMKELSGEVKALKKSLAKYEKQLEKLKNKGEKKEKVEDTEEKEIVDEISLNENDPESGPQLEEESEMDEDMDIYEVLQMQKIAGILSETEYNAKVEEAKKKPSAGMTKKEKSALSKKAHAGKDIGKKGPGFEKVAKVAAKQYGSEEAGNRVAAAAMWKNAAKK